MSSSRGGVPTAADALEIMEAATAALAVRPAPAEPVVPDRVRPGEPAPVRRVGRARRAGSAGAAPRSTGLSAYDRATAPRRPRCRRTAAPLPFGTLASIVDVTTGDEEQTLRIVRDLDPAQPIASLDDVRPRLDRAQHWIDHPGAGRAADPRTDLAGHARCWRPSTTTERSSLGHAGRRARRELVAGRPDHPRVRRTEAAGSGCRWTSSRRRSCEVAQRQFFALLYQLLVGRDTGPRLPTLLLAVGADKVHTLLTP